MNNSIQNQPENKNTRYRFLSSSKKRIHSLAITTTTNPKSIQTFKKSQGIASNKPEKKLSLLNSKLVQRIKQDQVIQRNKGYKLLQIRGSELMKNEIKKQQIYQMMGKDLKKYDDNNRKNIHFHNFKKMKHVLAKKLQQNSKLNINVKQSQFCQQQSESFKNMLSDDPQQIINTCGDFSIKQINVQNQTEVLSRSAEKLDYAKLINIANLINIVNPHNNKIHPQMSDSNIIIKQSSKNKTRKYTINLKNMTEFQRTQFYQELILKNPQLYHKIIKSYQNQKNKFLHNNINVISQLNKNKNQTTQTNSPKRNVKTSEPRSSYISNCKKQTIQIYVPILFAEFNFFVNLSNKIIIKNIQPNPNVQIIYKAFICKGNNGVLIKTLLKTRPWWNLSSNADIPNCNLIWSQWKKPKIYQLLKESSIKTNKKIPEITLIKQNQSESQISNKKIQYLYKLFPLFQAQYPQLKSCISLHPFLTFNLNKKVIKKQPIKIPDFYACCSIQKNTLQEIQGPINYKIFNHLQGGLHLHSKKLLYLNLKQYCELNKKSGLQIFDFVPVTYVVKKVDSKQYLEFINNFTKIQQRNKAKKKQSNKKQFNIWICKPGQNSNRGNGIFVHDNISQIKQLLKSHQKMNRTLIIQKYIDYPFLYYKRKFDIRCYLLLTCINRKLKAYWYDEGYIRTSSKQFTLKNIDNRMIHLTNDAVQKKSQQYGKFQNSNKISFQDFQKYLDNLQGRKYKLQDAYHKMKHIACHMVKSVAHCISGSRKNFTFQLFGLDFMLDQNFKPYLIEANSNPCLQVSGNVLSKIIPQLIDNVLRMVIDPIFSPNQLYGAKFKRFKNVSLQHNKFELIFKENEGILNSKQSILKEIDMEQQINQEESEQLEFINE